MPKKKDNNKILGTFQYIPRIQFHNVWWLILNIFLDKNWLQAIWYTSEKGDYNGDVLGSSDKWDGIGIFFDSFDNDNKHNNPYIMAVLNDGSKQFDHQKYVIDNFNSRTQKKTVFF